MSGSQNKAPGFAGGYLLFFANSKKATAKSELCYKVVGNVFPDENLLEVFKEKNYALLGADGAFFRPSGLALKVKTMPLSSSWRVNNGLNPGNVRHILFSKSKESAKHRKLLLGRDLQRFQLTWSGTWVNFDPSLKTKLKPSDIKSKAGMTAQTKVDFAFRSPEIYAPPKIMVRKTADHIVACLDEGDYCFDSLSYGIQAISENDENPLYLLGLLNSKFLNQIHSGLSQNKDKVFAKVLAENLKKLPLPILDLTNANERAKHDKLVALVEKMLALHQQLAAAKTPQDSTQLQRQIVATDKQIDQLVYQLYGLTDEEIALVEKQ